MIITKGLTDLQMWQTNSIFIIALTPFLARWNQQTPSKFVQQIRGVQIFKKKKNLEATSKF